MPKLLSSYSGPTFPDPNHPGFGLPYLILNSAQGPGKFSLDCSLQGLSHRVTFCVPWEGLAQFVQFVLMGTTAPGGGPITRTLPLQSPYVAIFPNTYATRVSGNGDSSDNSVTDSRLFSDCVPRGPVRHAHVGAGRGGRVHRGQLRRQRRITARSPRPCSSSPAARRSTTAPPS